MSVSPQPPEYFSQHGLYAMYRPVREVTLDQAVGLVDDAILYCRENNIVGLLVDVNGLTGFPPPSVTERFWFATTWAETANRKVVMAIVAPENMIASDKIGVVVATNRGMRVDAFTTEDEAIEWLLSALDEHEPINISAG